MYSPLRLKNLIDQKGISVEKLASELNLREEDISLYINDVFEADIEILALLADYFDVSIDYLLQRTDNPHSHKK